MLTGPLRPTRLERYSNGGFTAEILLPAPAEELIDEDEFDADERLPYWAELWPAARSLTAVLVDEPRLPNRVIELGCGVGLPSLALCWRGVRVVASDYYEDALRYVAENARHNGIDPPERLNLDWRSVPAGLPRFPLAVAADVLYEERNSSAFAAAIHSLVEPGGSVLLADPDRVHLGGFLRRMTSAGWALDELPEHREMSPAGNGMQVRVRLFRLDRPPLRPKNLDTAKHGTTLPAVPPSLV